MKEWRRSIVDRDRVALGESSVVFASLLPQTVKFDAMNTTYKWLPVISDFCTGCGKCVEACPRGCLELEWDFATLPRAGDCVSEGDCVEVCPENGIRMEWVKTTGSPDVGIWCESPKPAPSPSMRWLGCLFQKRSDIAD